MGQNWTFMEFSMVNSHDFAITNRHPIY